MCTADWNKIAAVLAAIATVVMAFYAVLTWRLQKQLTWWTGALESHSTIQLRMLAQKEGKPVVWWDPTHDDPSRKTWPENPNHRDAALVDTVYVGLPLHMRRNPKL
jgi:hypothetical protein